MENSNYNIHIIGAGISGLIAATVLEQNGFHPVIIEATERVGGRVKTDIIDGYQLDHGFQVLLTEPKDLEGLESMLIGKVQTNPDNDIYAEMLIWVSLQQHTLKAIILWVLLLLIS